MWLVIFIGIPVVGTGMRDQRGRHREAVPDISMLTL